MLIPRHQRILGLLNERGHLMAGEAARLFAVTPMTVWRDFKTLDELGLLRRVRGGVRAVGGGVSEKPFEAKERAESSRKERIAARAAREFVRRGMTVVLESGTTVAAMAGHLPESRVSVLTHCIPLALQVRATRPDLPLRMVGGWLNSVSGNLTGRETVREIGRLRADLCFIGAVGFEATVGPSDPNPLDVEVKRAWIASARRTVLLIGADKFGRRASTVTVHPRRLHAVVTDAHPPADVCALLERHGVALVVAD